MKTTTATILQLPAKLLATFETAPREEIRCARIDADARAVVTTNGKSLVSIPIPGTGTIRPGYILPELWKAAKAMARKGPIVLDYAAGTIAGLPYPQEHPAGHSYPAWRNVIPDNSAPSYRVRLSPALLATMADALTTADDGGVILDLPADPAVPMTLRTATGSGVLMPWDTTKHPETFGLLTPSESAPERSPATAATAATAFADF